MQKTPFSIVFLNIFIFSAKTGILVLDGVFTKQIECAIIPDFRIQHLNIVIVLKKQHEIRF